MAIARRSRPGLRVLRILFTDADATDSSGDEEQKEEKNAAVNSPFARRVKRQVRDISFEDHMAVRVKPRERRSPHAATGSHRKKFRGVRQRPWGRFSAEIRDSVALQKRLWLGTFDTAEEAASVYDLAAVKLKGDKAVTNFPAVKRKDKPEAVEREAAQGRGEASPKSVILYGEDELRFDDCFGYGDVDALGFGVGEEETLCVPESCFWMTGNWGEEEEEEGEIELGEIELGEIEDFLVSEMGDVEG